MDIFLKKMSRFYEIVIFTASIPKYAIPIINNLDPKGLISHRLFRDSCTLISNNFVKDLSFIGRDLSKTIIIDNSPGAYMLQPNNAIPIETWLNDRSDRQLLDLIPNLEMLSIAGDIRVCISDMRDNNGKFRHFSILQSRIKAHRCAPRNLKQHMYQGHYGSISIHIKLNKDSIELPKGRKDSLLFGYNPSQSIERAIFTARNFGTNNEAHNSKKSITAKPILEHLNSNSSTLIKLHKRIQTSNSIPNFNLITRPDTATNNLIEEAAKPITIIKDTNIIDYRINELKEIQERIKTARTSPRDMIRRIRHVGTLIENKVFESVLINK